MRKVRMSLVAVVLLAALVSCASFTDNTYKTLFIAGTTYDTSMKSVASLQSQGIISPAQRVEINKYANIYYVAYQVAVDAFIIYKKTETADAKTKVTFAISEMFLKWPTYADYVNRIKPGTIPSRLETEVNK